MMRSLFSGVSGLKSHQTRMDVIGNNIANVNTVGYKASRMVFQDLFSQTMANASGATDNVGGTNTRQIGLGVSGGAIDMLFTRSAQQTTGRPMDFMINGDGFFVVHDQNALGSVVNYDPASPPANGLDGGVMYTRAGNLYLDVDNNLVTADGFKVMGWMHTNYDPDGQGDYTDATLLPLESDMQTGELQYIKIVCEDADGEPTVLFNNFAIDDKGMITATRRDDGAKVYFGYIALARFQNQEGLEKIGNNMYRASNNSGYAEYAAPGRGGFSTIKAGTLEMSNVDLADSFTDMIITQRGFQANSRTITTTDSMLEELVNLKR